MKAKASVFSVTRLMRRFARDGRGAAAIEFAIILPVMAGVAFATSEICNAISLERKLTVTSRAISDIVAQSLAVSDADMLNVLKAGKVMLQPFPETTLKLRVTAVNIDNSGKATVAWSDASAGDPRGTNTAVTLPTALLIPNTQIIWGEVAYNYTPLPSIIKPLWPFTYEQNQFFARPRDSSGKVCRPACS
jgi:Flp pilus assembly protein TadG